MAGLYGGEDDIVGDEVDVEKPVWDDDIDIDDIIGNSTNTAEKNSKKKKKKKEDGKKATEDGVDIDDMDADITKTYDPDEEWDGTEEMRKRKLDEYMDEIYGMDFNDMVS
jgi:protein KRI1